MSEVMTSESIIEAEWILGGYWTRPRFAFQLQNGAWSDVDVLAYHPERKHLVIAESKVHGPKDRVFAYTRQTAAKYGTLLEFRDGHYLSFLRHLPTLCKSGCVFEKFKPNVENITVQLVSNYAIEVGVRSQVEKDLRKQLSTYKLPRRAHFQLDSTLDVIARIINKERESTRGRRYGNPVLDIARELNRYFHPSISYAGKKSSIGDEMLQPFLKALGVRRDRD